MKKIICGLAFLITSTVFAATSTDMNSQWICTTNASSSSVEADKNADDQMAKNQSSAKESFEFAANHCRDCTEITCEIQK